MWPEVGLSLAFPWLPKCMPVRLIVVVLIASLITDGKLLLGPLIDNSAPTESLSYRTATVDCSCSRTNQRILPLPTKQTKITKHFTKSCK